MQTGQIGVNKCSNVTESCFHINDTAYSDRVTGRPGSGCEQADSEIGTGDRGFREMTLSERRRRKVAQQAGSRSKSLPVLTSVIDGACAEEKRVGFI